MTFKIKIYFYLSLICLFFAVNMQSSAVAEDSADCLVCHNGTNASDVVSDYNSHKHNSHPISVLYPLFNPEYHTPPNTKDGWADVKLNNGKIECTSCHKKHEVLDFAGVGNGLLVVSNQLTETMHGSKLCFRCHDK